MTALDRLAELAGIEPFYYEISGQRRDVSRETKRALLAAMGFQVETEADSAAALAEFERRPWHRLLSSVHFYGQVPDMVVPVTQPAAETHQPITWTLTLEDGVQRTGTAHPDALYHLDQAEFDGVPFVRRALTLPGPLPLGYHRIRIQIGSGDPGRPATDAAIAESSVIIAPDHGITPEEILPRDRVWGLSLQLYALRSRTDWGVGDFTDLARFSETAAHLGASLVGLNPLHALFPADPRHYSPYSPSSRIWLNPCYLDVAALAEQAACATANTVIATTAFQDLLTAAQNADLVDYAAVAGLKLPILRLLFEDFRRLPDDAPPRRAFADFCAQGGDSLARHALFEALHGHFYGQNPALWSWRSWPEPYRDSNSAAVRQFAQDHAEDVDFYRYLQWQADRQLAEAAARGRAAGLAVGLYRDLAVATTGGGGAAWGQPDIVLDGVNIGAPPDAFSPLGQNWGLAPLSPLGLVRNAYQPFVDAIRATMRHSGAIRIDHVMALQHLFWIPAGAFSAVEGAYVRYPLHDLTRIIALESRRNRCLVIGEDLGTVPEGFRPAMERAGILCYRVLYFERGSDGSFLPPAGFPRDSLVTVSTHDLPSLRGWFLGRDADWRARLNLYPDAETYGRDISQRRADAERLIAALVQQGLVDPAAAERWRAGAEPIDRALLAAVHRYLARSTGRIMMVQIEDALGEIEQANLPGTIDSHPNWRRRLHLDLDDLEANQDLQAVTAAVRQERPR